MPYDAPIAIDCQANKVQWTRAKRITIQTNEIVMKMVRLWFSMGCADHVRIRIKRGTQVIIPNYTTIFKEDPPDPTGFGPSYQGDNVEYQINYKCILRRREFLDVEYINADPSNNHMVVFRPEFVIKDPNRDVDIEGTNTGREPRTRAQEETTMIEVDSAFGARQASEQAARADRGAFEPIAQENTRVGHNRDDDAPKTVKYVPRYE